MPSNNVHVLEAHEMPSSVSIHSERNEPLFDLPSRQDISKEELRATIKRIYSPILKSMQVFGIYFGDTSFSSLEQPPGPIVKRFYISRCFCGMINAGVWLIFTMVVVSLCIEGGSSPTKFFLLMAYSVWCLATALSATICLLVLPITETKKSRFDKFLRSLLERRCDLRCVESSSKKAFLISILLVTFGTIAVTLIYVLLDMGIGRFQPWNRWQVFEVLSVIPTLFACGAWILPVVLFCITCEVLIELFNDLHKEVSSQTSVCPDVTRFIKEHRTLCDIVELADKIFSPILLAVVSMYIPMMCFNFYELVVSNLAKEEGLMFIMCNLYFFLASAAEIILLMVYGARVNEKIHSFTSMLETFDVSSSEESKLLMFMIRLQGEPIGLSVGGLVVITKSLSLTSVGVIVSYFAVMLSFPS